MFIFISGPMTNCVGYKSRFEEAEERLELAGFKPVNPAKFNEGLPKDFGKERILSHDLHILSTCDGIYMLKGWEQARGCNREYGYALGKGLPIAFEDEEFQSFDKISSTFDTEQIFYKLKDKEDNESR